MLVFFLCAALLFLPLPKELGRAADFDCIWEDGSHTRERFSEVYSSLAGAGAEGVMLFKDGKRGRIEAGEDFFTLVSALDAGSLPELLSLRPVLSRPERAAIGLSYGGRGYYDGEFFAWLGDRFARTSRTVFPEVFLMSGSLRAGVLAASGAETLFLGGTCELTGRALVGSAVSEVRAAAPFRAEKDAVYRDTAGGVRLVAALPGASSLTVRADFIDDDAFAACAQLLSLDLCGIPAWAFGREPFEGCKSLRYLHTTLSYPGPVGEYRRSVAPCGCYIYEVLR